MGKKAAGHSWAKPRQFRDKLDKCWLILLLLAAVCPLGRIYTNMAYDMPRENFFSAFHTPGTAGVLHVSEFVDDFDASPKLERCLLAGGIEFFQAF